MAKTKKNAAKKKTERAPWGSKKASLPESNGLLTIEENPPPPVRAASLETLALHAKVDALMKTMKVGQAFILPLTSKSTVQRHLKINYPERKFLFAKVLGNENVTRVYRLEYKKPK